MSNDLDRALSDARDVIRNTWPSAFSSLKALNALNAPDQAHRAAAQHGVRCDAGPCWRTDCVRDAAGHCQMEGGAAGDPDQAYRAAAQACRAALDHAIADDSWALLATLADTIDSLIGEARGGIEPAPALVDEHARLVSVPLIRIPTLEDVPRERVQPLRSGARCQTLLVANYGDEAVPCLGALEWSSGALPPGPAAGWYHADPEITDHEVSIA